MGLKYIVSLFSISFPKAAEHSHLEKHYWTKDECCIYWELFPAHIWFSGEYFWQQESVCGIDSKINHSGHARYSDGARQPVEQRG